MEHLRLYAPLQEEDCTTRHYHEVVRDSSEEAAISDDRILLSDLLETLKVESQPEADAVMLEHSPDADEPPSPSDVLLVCFSESDGESQGSEVSQSCEESRQTQLRCPHFRNKCGIKRQVQTSKISFSTFETPQ